MAYNINPPPILSGSEAMQLKAMHDYLYKMHESLNITLNSLGEENLTQEARTAFKTTAATGTTRRKKDSGGSDTDTAQQLDELRSLIRKTADSVQSEMDKIETTLTSSYVAASEFGTVVEELRQTITETAEATTQRFTSSEIVRALQEGMTDFSDYQTETEQYIKTGLLYYEEVEGVSVPRYGVAVGEIATEVSGDGEVLLSRGGLVATFTSDRLAFWQSGVEMARFESARMIVENAEIRSSVSIGRYTLKRMKDGSLAFMFGGEK